MIDENHRIEKPGIAKERADDEDFKGNVMKERRRIEGNFCINTKDDVVAIEKVYTIGPAGRML